MKTASYVALGAALVSSASAAALQSPAPGKRDFPGLPDLFKDTVNADGLMAMVKLEDLKAGLTKLQEFGSRNQNTRVFGGPGHKETVEYLFSELKKLNYYDVEKQEQKQVWSQTMQSLSVNGKKLEANGMTYSPSAKLTSEVKLANNLGCAAGDYPADVKDKIALIQRGECSFGEKSKMAHKAGAAGVIVYNNVDGRLSGTLGAAGNDYAPAIGISQKDGQDLVSQSKSGVTLNADFFVDAKMENRTTWNVIAKTKGGDKANTVVLGAHTDSVQAGPGINDNGSGTIGLLTIAKALKHYKVKNAVQFCFWTAEEFGLLGSEYYVANLNAHDLSKLRLYMNFDMIASPNHVFGIYDGDGSAFNLTGPAGSAQIEKLFEKYFSEVSGFPSVPTAFTGRSDYAAFIAKKIPSGGLFTGAEQLKTAKEAVLFGGEAGKAYDANYHLIGDDIKNINWGAYLVNARAAAYATAEYARSVSSLPPKEAPPKAKREAKIKGYGGDLLGMCEEKACDY